MPQSLPSNIASNISVPRGWPKWRGWDAGKRLWQISDAPNNGGKKYCATDGERFLYADTLEGISERLANCRRRYYWRFCIGEKAR